MFTNRELAKVALWHEHYQHLTHICERKRINPGINITINYYSNILPYDGDVALIKRSESLQYSVHKFSVSGHNYHKSKGLAYWKNILMDLKLL